MKENNAAIDMKTINSAYITFCLEVKMMNTQTINNI